MATSPNFSWPEPDNTDLVKNGALAIRTAVNAIDSSLVDLKGGTTGQVLSKASNTDMDFTWATDASGIPATIFDAKGDIIAATAADTASRLAVGTNGQVLTADSTAATGLKWASASSTPTFIGCDVSFSSQAITTNTYTMVNCTSENFDTDGFHDNSTNNTRITIPTGKAGKYLFLLRATFEGQNNAQIQCRVGLAKNGSVGNTAYVPYTNPSDVSAMLSIIVNAAVGDYYEMAVWHNYGSNRTVYGNNDGRFQAIYLGA